MFNILKVKIPIGGAQEINELESWTLQWSIQGDSYRCEKVFYKCFISKEEAEEYQKQLLECAQFLGTWVKSNIKKN